VSLPAGATRLVVRLPSWLGDFVMAEPVARAAWERRSAVRDAVGALTLVAPAPFLGLLEGRFPGARLIPVADRDDAGAYRGNDVALFLNGSLASVLAAVRAGVHERIGWAGNGRAAFLTRAITRARERGARPIGWGREPPMRRSLPRPFGSDCVELAAQAGIEVRDTRARLVVRERVRDQVRSRLESACETDETTVVAVNVGARARSAKGVPPESWAAVIEGLAEEADARFVLLGGPGEEDAVRRVEELVARARVLAVLQPTASLEELAAWAERSSLFLCADGGARHVAKAVGARTLVLFGPTDPRHTAEDLEQEELLVASVPCGPCHLEHCPMPGAGHHACMRLHRPERVVEIALRILARHDLGMRAGY
jgi:ADP-heptose:LPS heptosyltransferase